MFAITYKANDEVRHVYTVRLPIYISLYKIELVFMGIKQPAWARSNLIKSVVLVTVLNLGILIISFPKEMLGVFIKELLWNWYVLFSLHASTLA